MRALCLILCLSAPPALAQGIEVYGETTATFTPAPSVETFVEAAHRGLYAGVWVQAGPAPEIDLYAGFRGTLRTLDYDLFVTRYLYPGESNGTELTLGLGKDIGRLRLDADLTYEPAPDLASLSLEAEFAASDQTTLTTSFGLFETDLGPYDREWIVGAEHTLSDHLTAEASVTGGTAGTGTFSLSLVWQSR